MCLTKTQGPHHLFSAKEAEKMVDLEFQRKCDFLTKTCENTHVLCGEHHNAPHVRIGSTKSTAAALVLCKSSRRPGNPACIRASYTRADLLRTDARGVFSPRAPPHLWRALYARQDHVRAPANNSHVLSITATADIDDSYGLGLNTISKL
jgi:hypothetical protein